MTEQQKATTADELHVAICQAVTLMNVTPSREPEFHEAHTILRTAMAEFRATPQPSPQRDEESTAQEAAPVALRAALISCARMFQTYVDIHVKKGDEAKAARNREMVELCNRALAATDTPASAVAAPVTCEMVKAGRDVLRSQFPNISATDVIQAYRAMRGAAPPPVARSDAAPVAQEVSEAMTVGNILKILGAVHRGDADEPTTRAIAEKAAIAISALQALLNGALAAAQPFDTRSPCGDPNVTVAARDAVTGEPTMFVRAKGGAE